MSQINQTNNGKETYKSAHVRLDSEQQEQILADSKERGVSIPTLLRNTYFEKRHRCMLMSKDEAKALTGQVLRAGNNLNQIARKLNSGYSWRFSDELVEANNTLTEILREIRTRSGRPEPKKEERDDDNSEDILS